MIGAIAALAPTLFKVFDKLTPDKAEEAKAAFNRMALEGDQSIKDLEAKMSAIVMEAQSSDPWTSRARPSFMYVVYAYLLMGPVMGVVFVFSPESSAGVTEGVRLWLEAIPGEMWTLFGAGYLGYAGLRTSEKRKLMDKAR